LYTLHTTLVLEGCSSIPIDSNKVVLFLDYSQMAVFASCQSLQVPGKNLKKYFNFLNVFFVTPAKCLATIPNWEKVRRWN